MFAATDDDALNNDPKLGDIKVATKVRGGHGVSGGKTGYNPKDKQNVVVKEAKVVTSTNVWYPPEDTYIQRNTEIFETAKLGGVMVQGGHI